MKLSPEQQFQAADLYRQGWTLAEIARILPASREQIRQVVRRAGIQRRNRGPRPGRGTTPRGAR